MNNFYVYFHKNKITNEIFYVGKGKNNRAYVKDNRGNHYNNYIKKFGEPSIEIVKDGLTNEDALELEIFYIKKFGRKELNDGCLVNSTDGGEFGVLGYKHTHQTKEKIRVSRVGKVGNNKGLKWKLKIDRTGIKRGKYKQRIDKGKNFSDEIKEKFSEGKRNKSKKVLQYDLNNNFIKEWRCAVDVIDELGIKGLYNCLTNISNSSGGYKWIYKK